MKREDEAGLMTKERKRRGVSRGKVFGQRALRDVNGVKLKLPTGPRSLRMSLTGHSAI
jgi:hypothetical protein